MNERPGNSTMGSTPGGDLGVVGRLPSSGSALPYEERMIDESVDESFPASDPPASSQPGNIVWQRYAAAAAVERSRASARWWVGLAMIAAGVACATVLLARRPRRSSR